jgi:hypothetical protein
MIFLRAALKVLGFSRRLMSVKTRSKVEMWKIPWKELDSLTSIPEKLGDTTNLEMATSKKNAPSSSISIWLGFAETRPTGRGSRRVHLRWGRILALLIALGFGLWITAAFGALLPLQGAEGLY